MEEVDKLIVDLCKHIENHLDDLVGSTAEDVKALAALVTARASLPPVYGCTNVTIDGTDIYKMIGTRANMQASSAASEQ